MSNENIKVAIAEVLARASVTSVRIDPLEEKNLNAHDSDDSDNVVVEVVEVWMDGDVISDHDDLSDITPAESIAEYGAAKIRINGRILREEVPLIVTTSNVLTRENLSDAYTCAWVLAGERKLSGGDAEEFANELQRGFGFSIWSEQFEYIKQEIEAQIADHPEISAARERITAIQARALCQLAGREG